MMIQHCPMCPHCGNNWGQHQKNCKYYTHPQHTYTEAEMAAMKRQPVSSKELPP